MKIAIDIDDVLADYLTQLVKFHNRTYKTALKKSDFVSLNFWEIWGGTKKQSIEKVYRFYKTAYFKNIKPFPGSLETLKKLKKRNELVVITSRQYDLIYETEAWLKKYFPGIFSGIYFSNNFSAEGSKFKKSVFCDRLGIDAVIEDSFEYATECLKPNRKIILFRRPWNENLAIPKGIWKVNSWEEIPMIIKE